MILRTATGRELFVREILSLDELTFSFLAQEEGDFHIYPNNKPRSYRFTYESIVEIQFSMPEDELSELERKFIIRKAGRIAG